MLRRKKASHLTTGERGERAARLFLRLRGYRILERNYLCPLGEIDIVARNKSVFVFVEVRTRQPDALVDPLESITDLKLAYMMDAARYYLTVHRKGGIPSRFDFISVRPGGPFRGRIKHYPDAFRTTDERAVRGSRLRAWHRQRPRL